MGKKGIKLNRRQFLKASAATGVLAGTVGPIKLAQSSTNESGSADNKDIKFVRSTCSPNCTSSCGITAMVVDGQIKTLSPTDDYPEPEYGPRGCLRGLSFLNLIYGPDRLEKPLIRTGDRGKGEFREASWEEALDYCAEGLQKVADKYGPESIGASFQVGGTGFVQKGAWFALASQAGWNVLHAYDLNGDLPMFWPMTFGVQTEELEPLEWANSDYTAIFGSNVTVTRLMDSDFLINASENGMKLLVVDPSYTPTASKADQFLQIKPSSDAAMALGIARVIVDEGLYDSNFIKTFTDLPLLVRTDNGKRLQADDVSGLSSVSDSPAYRNTFVSYNGQLVSVNPEKLDLPSDVLLEAEQDVTLKDGSTVKTKTVFKLLKESLQTYTPEYVTQETGLDWDTVYRIAHEMAASKALHIVYGASNYQWYHGDLKGRALALIPVLTGNIGKSGAGISTYAGQYRVRFNIKDWWFPKEPKWTPWLYFLHGRTDNMVAPFPENGIKSLVFGWHNPFDQHNMSNKLRDMATEGELEFIVAMDFQRSTSCNWADVVFPAASWYEKLDLTATPLHPYVQLQQPAIEPFAQRKSELWIARELAKRLNPEFEQHYFPELSAYQAAEQATEVMLRATGRTTEDMTLEKLKKGPMRLKLNTPQHRQIPFYEEIQHKQPFPPISNPAPLKATAQFVKSGRIEFYKDEDTFIELGETLPVHKRPFEDSEYALNPSVEGKYKFVFITRNSLYRIHSTHSNNIWMNELQDHKPKVFLNPDDAKEKGIKDGDKVELYNDRGRVTAFASIDPGTGKNVATFVQGWWDRYLDNESYNTLTYPFIKPTHEIYFVPGIWAPNTCWNECLIDVRKVGEGK